MTQKPFKCPVCDGSGKVSRPPWVPGDIHSWSSTSVCSFPCQACTGTGIVWSPERAPQYGNIPENPFGQPLP